MKGATRGSLKDAVLAGKTACPVCCASAGTLVYCTSGGKSYHLDKNCQGMTGAKQVTLAEAMVLGKTKCDVCIKGSATVASEAAGVRAPRQRQRLPDQRHRRRCEGVRHQERHLLSHQQHLQRHEGRPAVHAEVDAAGGQEGLPDLRLQREHQGVRHQGRQVLPLLRHLLRHEGCQQRLPGRGAGGGLQALPEVLGLQQGRVGDHDATASNTYVYATREGSYYHLNSGCGGMTGASRITLKTAVQAGKKPCPTCASAARRTVYSTSNGDHYHVATVCAQSGMKNGTKRTLAEALLKNQTACPYCLSSKKAAAAAIAAASGGLRAARSRHDAPKEQPHVQVRQIRRAGIRLDVREILSHQEQLLEPLRDGQPGDAGDRAELRQEGLPRLRNLGHRTVYATRGGKYYHYSKSDAGAGAKQGTLAAALAYGFDPCPNCVKRTAEAVAAVAEAEGEYKTGTSGIKVYATAIRN